MAHNKGLCFCQVGDGRRMKEERFKSGAALPRMFFWGVGVLFLGVVFALVTTRHVRQFGDALVDGEVRARHYLGATDSDRARLAGLETTRSLYRQAVRRLAWEVAAGTLVFLFLALGSFLCVMRTCRACPMGAPEPQACGADRRGAGGKTVDFVGGEGGPDERNAVLEELITIFSNSMVGIMLLKGGRYVSKANDRMARIFGYDSPEEMEGLSMRAFHLSEERFHHYGATHYNALVHGERTQIDYQLRRRDGSPVWCTVSGKAVDDHVPPDLNRGVLWVVDDITERKMAERALRESEERFREMAELLPCIVCEVDLSLGITYVNSLALKVFSISPEDFQKPGVVLEAFHPEDRPQVVRRLEMARGGGEVGPAEYRMIRGSGEEMRVLFHSAPIIKNRAVVGLRASLTDVTEYRAMQETLLTQGKLDVIASLIGGIAHDFNNMMAVMMGRVDLAMLSLDEGHPSRDHLATVEETLQRARDLVARLITLSTRGEGVNPSIPLADVLCRCVAHLGGEADGVHLDLASPLPPISVDGPQMGQAMESVLSNALESCDGKGEVWVTCAVFDKGHKRHPALMGAACVEVAVRDRGRGIAEEHLSRIFDPYYTTKERSARKGMGFGLAVTQAVVTRHGGSLAVESRPGEGTTVYICLPLMGPGRGSEA